MSKMTVKKAISIAWYKASPIIEERRTWVAVGRGNNNVVLSYDVVIHHQLPKYPAGLRKAIEQFELYRPDNPNLPAMCFSKALFERAFRLKAILCQLAQHLTKRQVYTVCHKMWELKAVTQSEAYEGLSSIYGDRSFKTEFYPLWSICAEDFE